MRALPIALAVSLAPAVAMAADPQCSRDTCPPYAHSMFVRTLVGLGGVPGVQSANATLTAELGGRPFSQPPWDIGAFSTGIGFTSTTDLTGRFSLMALGLFAKMDLTHNFLSGLWSVPPRRSFPFRLQIGARLGIAASESFSKESHYVLVRPEMLYFLDLEVPVDDRRIHSILLRGALDTSVDTSDPFRWSLSIGLDYGWNP